MKKLLLVALAAFLVSSVALAQDSTKMKKECTKKSCCKKACTKSCDKKTEEKKAN